MSNTDRLAQLSQAGVSIWLDDLSRQRIESGNLEQLIRDKHVVGVTTNPTIFAKALSEGTAYNEQLRKLAQRGADVHAATRTVTTTDVRTAADLLHDVYRRTNGTDGRVSIEVDPGLARDTEQTVAEAKELWETVDRPNIFVKIPATEEGLPAITQALAQGISVNVTLIFSPERYRAVIEAFFSGLEQAQANGHDLADIQSVASFFVSRVDTEVDQRLEALGTEEAVALRGRAAVANARLAYAAYEELFAGQRWQDLKQAGANPQRPLWASTGVKNPDYPGTLYIDELVVAGTVNTMPATTLETAADHAQVDGDKVSGRAAEAQEVFNRLAEIGINITDVFHTLEKDGVDKFVMSWSELLDTVGSQLEQKAGV